MDVTLRRPRHKKENERQLKLPLGEFVPGWKGKRCLLCTDGKWHVVLEIRKGYQAETQCAEDTKVAQQEDKSEHPMCELCATLAWKPRR